MVRPMLTKQISVAEFGSYYWLKEELVLFCREQHLPTSGSKEDLANRISQFLAGEKLYAKPSGKLARDGVMPKVFTHTTMIEPGWRCSQELRAFFEREIGPHFHFDAAMRELIHQGSGKTLEEVIHTWENERTRPAIQKEIAPQFEYNRHMRAYFQDHPGGTLQDAILAWKEKRQVSRGD